MALLVESVFNYIYVILPFVACTVFLGIVFILTTFLTFVTIITTIAWNPIASQYFRVKGPKKSSKLTIAFFHPYCDTGGGGERVLWCAINAMKRQFPEAQYVVYTGDVHVSGEQILSKAQNRFQIQNMNWMKDSDNGVKFIYLHKRAWVEAKTYPRFTLLGQSLGSIYLAWEAIMKLCPDIYIDTTGYAFTLPLFKNLGKCKVGCYVHYPTISSDMLRLVKSRSSTYNNASGISQSWILSSIKLRYYKIFAFLYRVAGQYSDVTMVNSSWTEDHIRSLWNSPRCDERHSGNRCGHVHKVFPPCDNTEFLQIERSFDRAEERSENIKIISIGQFRPEKDHPMQIRTMFEVRKILSERDWKRVRLVIAGGSRNEEDNQRIKELQDLCKHLSVEENVEFKINIPFGELKREMSESLIGLHTMWNEHFGIAVVEMLASGLITIAHRSGGPQMDIISESKEFQTGFLAIHDVEYAESIVQILKMSNDSRHSVIQRARSSVKRFSDTIFESEWIRVTSPLVS